MDRVAWPARLPALLLVLVFLLGAAFAAVLPPFQLSDEHAHFIRAYTISQGHLLGSAQPVLPPAVSELIERYPEVMEARKLEARAGQPGPTVEGRPTHMYLAWGILGANIYCPIAYLPASLAILGGRLAGLSPLALLYTARLASLCAFVAALYLIFRIAPEYRLLYAALALLPMTLHQVSGVSADGLTIAISLVATAALLWFRYHPADRRSLLLTALVFCLWVLCKMSPWAFGALLLLPIRAFASRRAWVLYVGAVMAGMLLCAVGWQLLAHQNFEMFRAGRLSRGIDMAVNLDYVKSHPVQLLEYSLSSLRENGKTYIGQFVGAFGWSRFALPVWARSLSLCLLLLVAACESTTKPLSWLERAAWFCILLGGVICLHVILFVSDGGICSEGGAATLCFNQSAGIQGRYLLPLSIFGLVAIRQRRVTVPPRLLELLVPLGGAIHALASIQLMWSRYWA